MVVSMMQTTRKLRMLVLSVVLTSSFWSSFGYAALPMADGAGRELPSLAPMLERVNPAVVNIATFSRQQTYNPLLNDPFFRRFFDIPRQQQQMQKRQSSAGSGVIVDANKGIVMTNFHVIKDADEVLVALIDGREFQAQLLGVDPELDIAVLKIDARDIAEVPMADSSKLQVGDFAVAIGNPFGLGQTVTTGVISALGRTGLGMEGYENFIQTDASINPGNSGGALVNLHGELIGINTAIISPAGGNIGIGFAIPINMARASFEQIIETGEVRRGHIGISIQDITPDLRRAFKLASGQQGVLITGVQDNSPAAKAGILAGDIVVAIQGESTRTSGQLRSQIGSVAIGRSFDLVVLRDNRAQTFKVKVEDPLKLISGDGDLHPLLYGARLENASAPDGVIVTGLKPNSPALYSGLRVGDFIVGANQIRTQNIQELAKAVRKNSDKILLHINRNGSSLYLVVR